MTMEKLQMLICLALALMAVPILFVGLTLALGAITWLRWDKKDKDKLLSGFYVGRVAHSRFRPTIHSFAYPFFWMAVELNTEADDLWLGIRPRLWPLSTIMALRHCDHYKNGEGLSKESESHLLAQRTLHLVRQRTNQRFSPSLKTHRVVLVSHLCYYGYCFNPVSFYFVFEKETSSRHPCAVVAEVSNTPWNEMQCYVLHEESVDVSRVDVPESSSVNYIFPKTFHVSPFMEMSYDYDWVFTRLPVDKSFEITTAMVHTSPDRKLQFRAHVSLQRHELHPFTCACYLVKFPIYCMLVQLWIHYEAFWLFVKGVAYQPHPKDSETTASRIIGTAMTPLFALKDWWLDKGKME